MKTVCAYTRYPLMQSNLLFPSLHLPSLHPIFYTPRDKILELLIVGEGIYELSPQQQALALLGITHSMGLINWEGIKEGYWAAPSPATCLANLEKAIYLAGRKLPRELPKLALCSTADPLEGMAGLLDSIISDLANIRNFSLDDRISELQNRIEILLRACSAGEGKEKLLKANIAAWALAATEEHFRKEHVTKETVEYWKQILTTSPADLQKLGDRESLAVDVTELEDFLLTYLPLGNTASSEIFKHLRIIKEVTGNLYEFLLPGSIRIVTPTGEQAAPAPEITFSPKTPMPQKGSYKTIQEWIVALKEWSATSSGKAGE